VVAVARVQPLRVAVAIAAVPLLAAVLRSAAACWPSCVLVVATAARLRAAALRLRPAALQPLRLAAQLLARALPQLPLRPLTLPPLLRLRAPSPKPEARMALLTQ